MVSAARFVNLVSVAALALGAMCRPGPDAGSGKKDHVKMNEQIPLYSWVREGASVALGRIQDVRVQRVDGAQEQVVVQVKIDEVWSGRPGEPTPTFTFTRPAAEVARLKFPDPLWGRVTMQTGAPIFIVFPPGGGKLEPEYVEDAIGDEPVLRSIRAILEAEKKDAASSERTGRYLGWLEHGTSVEKLFGAEALARDPLAEVDPEGRVAARLAAAFAAERDIFVRISLGTWMWDLLLARTSASGRAAVLDATVAAVTDASPDVQRFALDRLADTDLSATDLQTVAPHPEAAAALRRRLAEESDPGITTRIQRLLNAMARSGKSPPVR
jgi:hypothetical protein